MQTHPLVGSLKGALGGVLSADLTRLGPPPELADTWGEGASDAAPAWVAEGTPAPLREALVQAVGEDSVLARATDIIRYASDASPYRLFPQVVVQPRRVGHIQALLRLAAQRRAPIVFRAGGTSLNGQGQTDSILVDVRRHWQGVTVLDDGERVRCQPGAVLGYVNRRLARHGRKLGPDPASTDVACVGGVIANNSGGMRCGVVADAYRTVESLQLVLANGAVIDTAAPGAEARFASVAPDLAAGLAAIRDELRADQALAERVRRKFQIKNTTGYRLCAFLDADTPLEIFRRLVIGSEGTLAFVAEATLRTVVLGRHATAGLIFFESVDAAVEAVPPLVQAGATATELMIAPTLIAAAWNMPGTPPEWKELPPTAAAILVEFRDDDPAALAEQQERALSILQDRPLVQPARLSQDHAEMEMLWRVREGMQGLLAAMRPPGVSLIIEDVCVAPDRIAEATRDLQALLTEHGFLPGVAGHASAGNLHFLLTPNFGEAADLERYEHFMQALVELIVGKYDGSLKAEHGTGLNMAPFVEREWGESLTEMMWQVKRLADPDGILAPGIVLNRDPGVHLRHLKSTPEIEPVATKCIECGFCEPVCPSRNTTTTPRQRIVLRREMARQPEGSAVTAALLREYAHDAVDTCAADGMCRYACPVAIDTGKMIKDFRARTHSPVAEPAGRAAARAPRLVEQTARGGLKALGSVVRIAVSGVPPAAPLRASGGLPETRREGAAAVYMPACINRIFASGGVMTVPEALVEVSRRAGLPVWIPDDIAGTCCGTPWSSKGLREGHGEMATRMGETLWRWSDGGRLPVVLDATSCTHGLLSEGAVAGVEVLDAVQWVHDTLLPRLPVRQRLGRIAVHPNCSAVHMGLSEQLLAIVQSISEAAWIPAGTGCCGMAGDRGWLHPELPRSALLNLTGELADEGSCDRYLSSNRTCEAALREVTGQPYQSFLLAFEEATR